MKRRERKELDQLIFQMITGLLACLIDPIRNDSDSNKTLGLISDQLQLLVRGRKKSARKKWKMKWSWKK
jgi:hypothetical protein